MAQLKGARVMVAAPNAATNRVLTSPGVLNECRRVAMGFVPKVAAAESSLGLSVKQMQWRYPVVVSMPVASSFRGTIRAGAALQGTRYGIPEKAARSAMGGKVTWK